MWQEIDRMERDDETTIIQELPKPVQALTPDRFGFGAQERPEIC